MFKPLTCSVNGCNDRTNWNNKVLESKIDKLVKNIPKMYCCRLDVRFNDINKFKNGDDFKIMEINGVMGYNNMALNKYFHISLKDFISKSIISLKWTFTRLYIGLINIITFNTCNPIYPIIYFFISIYYSIKCMDWGHIFYASLTC